MSVSVSSTLPQEVKAALWSYDLTKLDPDEHKGLIISATLNYGTKAATDWLLDYYGISQVKHVAQTVPLGAWDKRSLALWSTVLNIKPKSRLERLI